MDRPQCPICAYDVSGLASNDGRVKCPECGHEGFPAFAKPRVRGWRAALLLTVGLSTGMLLPLAACWGTDGMHSTIAIPIVYASAPVGTILSVLVARAIDRRHPIMLGGTTSGAVAAMGILVFVVSTLLSLFFAQAIASARY